MLSIIKRFALGSTLLTGLALAACNDGTTTSSASPPSSPGLKISQLDSHTIGISTDGVPIVTSLVNTKLTSPLTVNITTSNSNILNLSKNTCIFTESVQDCAVLITGESFGSATVSVSADGYTTQTSDLLFVNYEHLYSFDSNPSGGKNPAAQLLAESNGILYGTTQKGGNGYGTIFSFNSNSGVESTLFAFNENNGQNPQEAGSLIEYDGLLYGTTSIGGTNSSGVIFSFNLNSNLESVHYSFNNSGGDAYSPNAGLTEFNGLLYGTTAKGGENDSGAVFSFDPSNDTESVVFSFDGTNGSSILAGLTVFNGKLYGLANQGGTYGMGVVFSIESNNVESTIYEFGGESLDSASPIQDLAVYNNKLYGTTGYGGKNNLGTVFSIDPSNNTESVMFSFDRIDGNFPRGGLMVYGDLLYGTTTRGGRGDGVVFSINPSNNTESTIYNFRVSPYGYQPYATLTAYNGLLYGSTYYGSGTGSSGTLFTVLPTN